MEIFKSQILKKEFNELINKILSPLSGCGSCGKYSCQYHKKFFVTCGLCRDARCKNCCAFETSKEILLSGGDENSQKYVANFIGNFLGNFFMLKFRMK